MTDASSDSKNGRPTADVTVVISTFNRCKFLPEAISSILGQSVFPSRIVVVDDGSTDDTAAYVAEFGDKVEYLYKKNEGKAKALNAALATITTKYCWFFDDDDAAYPHALKLLLEQFEKSPDLGFAFGSFDVVVTEGQLTEAPGRPEPYGFAHESLAMQRLRMYRDCTVMMSGSLLRTEKVRLVGCLNEGLVRCQDYDLMVRLASATEFLYCGQSVYAWREHGGTRGTANASHDSKKRVEVWAAYNEVIGRQLRYRLPVSDFAVVSFNDSKHSTREALLNRAWALAPKLPLDQSVSDIVEGLRADPSGDLLGDDLDRLTSTFHHDFVSFRPLHPLWRLLALCWVPVGPRALGCLAKGLYWLALKEDGKLRQWKWGSMAVSLYFFSRLARLIH